MSLSEPASHLAAFAGAKKYPHQANAKEDEEETRKIHATSAHVQ
jgi:hypothetical protein